MAFTKVTAGAGASVGAGGSANAANPAMGPKGAGGWHPTVLYMLALIVLEIVIVGFLSRHLFGGE
jgi:hypothetical protein